MSFRAQSAFEFLVTYGWAILAVIVALSAIYSLGVFNLGGSTTGSVCSVVEGFSCSQPVLYSSGILTAGLGQVGQTTVITATGCSTNSTQPATWLSQSVIAPAGKVTNLKFACPGAVGSSIGSTFKGTLWIQYAGGSGTVTSEVAAIKAVVATNTNPPPSLFWSGSGPTGIAYNPQNNYVYITNSGDGTVNAISPSGVGTLISTGGFPYRVAYNPSNGYMYVTSYPGSNLYVISGTTVISTISTLGSNLAAVAYNPNNGYMYVASAGGVISLLSGTTVVSTYSAGSSATPYGLAYNPSNGYMYDVNWGSGTVNVISGNTIVSSIALGSSTHPEWIGYNPNNGYMYVTTFPLSGGASIYTISGTTVVGSAIPSGSSQVGEPVYNPLNGYMYVANYGNANVLEFSGRNLVGAASVGVQPDGMVFNPDNGYMYIANYNDGTVSTIN